MPLLLPFTSPYAADHHRPLLRTGIGHRLWDVAGREYLDAISGMWHVNFGYSASFLADAVREQLDRLPAGSLISTDHELAEALAERLTGWLDMRGAGVLLTNSGAESVEAALHLVDAIDSERPAKVVAFLPAAFHGNTGRARAMSGRAEPSTGLGMWCIELAAGSSSIRPLQQADLDARSVAAAIFEPIQGVAGVRPIAPAIRDLLERLQRTGALLISDEVGCGLGRAGGRIAARGFDLTPDVLLVSKGLTGGYAPLAAMVMGASALDRCRSATLAYGHTAAGSPLACALGLAVLDRLGQPRVQQAMLATAENLGRASLRLAQGSNALLRHVGLCAAIELPLSEPLGLDARYAAYRRFQNAGVMLRVAGDGRSIPIVPGFEFTDQDFADLETRAATVLLDLLDEQARPRLKARA